MPKLFLATIATYRLQSESLTKYNYKTRLLSYWLLRDHPDECLTHYVETGIALHKPKTRKRHWYKNRVAYLRARRIALAERLRRYEEMDKLQPKKCIECNTNLADLPSDLCPGCEAYREHTR